VPLTIVEKAERILKSRFPHNTDDNRLPFDRVDRHTSIIFLLSSVQPLRRGVVVSPLRSTLRPTVLAISAVSTPFNEKKIIPE